MVPRFPLWSLFIIKSAEREHIMLVKGKILRANSSTSKAVIIKSVSQHGFACLSNKLIFFSFSIILSSPESQFASSSTTNASGAVFFGTTKTFIHHASMNSAHHMCDRSPTSQLYIAMKELLSSKQPVQFILATQELVRRFWSGSKLLLESAFFFNQGCLFYGDITLPWGCFLTCMRTRRYWFTNPEQDAPNKCKQLGNIWLLQCWNKIFCSFAWLLFYQYEGNIPQDWCLKCWFYQLAADCSQASFMTLDVWVCSISLINKVGPKTSR